MSSGLTRFPAARAVLGCKSNATVRTWCEKWGVEIIELNSRAKAVRTADLERSLIAAAAAKELTE